MKNKLQNHSLLEVIYDAACPICLREMQWLMSKPKADRVTFTAIQSLPYGYEGRSVDQFMERMHARLPDGTWIQGVEVFRQLYLAMGLGWWVSASRLPIISHLLDIGYGLFAKYRLPLVGKCRGRTCSISGELQQTAA